MILLSSLVQTVLSSPERYVYAGTVVRVVDGDTVDVSLALINLAIDLGFKINLVLRIDHEVRVRLKDVYAPESYGAQASPEGRASKLHLEATLPVGTPLHVQTFKDKTEKYGRILATLWTLDGQGTRATTSVNAALVAGGWATATPS